MKFDTHLTFFPYNDGDRPSSINLHREFGYGEFESTRLSQLAIAMANSFTKHFGDICTHQPEDDEKTIPDFLQGRLENAQSRLARDSFYLRNSMGLSKRAKQAIANYGGPEEKCFSNFVSADEARAKWSKLEQTNMPDQLLVPVVNALEAIDNTDTAERFMDFLMKLRLVYGGGLLRDMAKDILSDDRNLNPAKLLFELIASTFINRGSLTCDMYNSQCKQIKDLLKGDALRKELSEFLNSMIIPDESNGGAFKKKFSEQECTQLFHAFLNLALAKADTEAQPDVQELAQKHFDVLVEKVASTDDNAQLLNKLIETYSTYSGQVMNTEEVNTRGKALQRESQQVATLA